MFHKILGEIFTGIALNVYINLERTDILILAFQIIKIIYFSIYSGPFYISKYFITFIILILHFFIIFLCNKSFDTIMNEGILNLYTLIGYFWAWIFVCCFHYFWPLLLTVGDFKSILLVIWCGKSYKLQIMTMLFFCLPI